MRNCPKITVSRHCKNEIILDGRKTTAKLSFSLCVYGKRHNKFLLPLTITLEIVYLWADSFYTMIERVKGIKNRDVEKTDRSG